MKRLFIAFFCVTPVYILPRAAHAEALHIRVPHASGMHLYSPDEYTNLVRFSGQVQLQGQLLLVSQSEIIDDEVEWRVTLLFQPDPAERDILPSVRYTHEADTEDVPVIELNFFQKDQIMGAIESIFAADIVAKAGKQVFEIGKRGRLHLKSYRTGIECDRRYHYAELVAFESQQALSATQATKLAQQMSGGYG